MYAVVVVVIIVDSFAEKFGTTFRNVWAYHESHNICFIPFDVAVIVIGIIE